MSAHTPGPWSVGWGTGFINQVQIEPAIGYAYGSGKEVKANARLIAAAPELLTALQGALESMETGITSIGVIQAARDAIAEATGNMP